MEAIRMSDELPILQEQFSDRKKIHKARVADLVWTDSESLPAARDVFQCLQKGASIDDLERESGRCSFWVYKVLSTLHGAGQIG
jgi:hypothetical protein